MVNSEKICAVLNALEGMNRKEWALLAEEIDLEFDRIQKEACRKVTLEASNELTERVVERAQRIEMPEKL